MNVTLTRLRNRLRPGIMVHKAVPYLNSGSQQQSEVYLPLEHLCTAQWKAMFRQSSFQSLPGEELLLTTILFNLSTEFESDYLLKVVSF